MEKDLQDLDVVGAERREEREENQDGGASRDIEEIRISHKVGFDSPATDNVSVSVSVCC